MVYFANKTRNHARGFRIQKHLLAANESCVPITQNCCATDFRKTVIWFVACQALRRIPPRKFGVPGRLAPFQHWRRPGSHRMRPRPNQQQRCHAPKHEPIERFAARRANNMAFRSPPPEFAVCPRIPLTTSRKLLFLDILPLNGKGAFRRPEQGRES